MVDSGTASPCFCMQWVDLYVPVHISEKYTTAMEDSNIIAIWQKPNITDDITRRLS